MPTQGLPQSLQQGECRVVVSIGHPIVIRHGSLYAHGHWRLLLVRRTSVHGQVRDAMRGLEKGGGLCLFGNLGASTSTETKEAS